MGECPCGTNFTYTDCCGPLIRGVGHADSAEDLMRSRYTAYTKKNWDYLARTAHPDEKPEDFSKGGEGIEWKRLEIVGSSKGSREDSEGEVSFVAHYTEDGVEKSLHETSKFLKENGRWYYCGKRSRAQVSPSAPKSTKPFVRDHGKVGRNDPCACGSGKKFKKCCGK